MACVVYIDVCVQENLFFTSRVSEPLSGKVNSCLSIYRQCCTLTCIPIAIPPPTPSLLLWWMLPSSLSCLLHHPLYCPSSLYCCSQRCCISLSRRSHFLFQLRKGIVCPTSVNQLMFLAQKWRKPRHSLERILMLIKSHISPYYYEASYCIQWPVKFLSILINEW